MKERSRQATEVRLRDGMVAARASYREAAREFESFYVNILDGKVEPLGAADLDRLAANQEAAFRVFERAAHTFLIFSDGTKHRFSVPPSSRLPCLTERELEVLGALAAGKTTRQLTLQLNIASRTISAHRAHLLKKFGARNVASLVSQAIQLGYIRP